MGKVEFLAKHNQDDSFSVSYQAGRLIMDSLVDFYNEQTGTGYQRNETLRAKRGRDIEKYIGRCVQEGIPPRLFEMTANARIHAEDFAFDPLDDDQRVGVLTISLPCDGKKWLSIIDGGTRVLGIENALTSNIIDRQQTFDVRMFVGLTHAEEVAQFLLINENQKKVRTDLSLRVVQRSLDEGRLTDQEKGVLQTVVPDTEAWRFEASRIAAKMNSDALSPWNGRIQMPGDSVRPLTLQAFFSSLRPILTEPEIKTRLDQMDEKGDLLVNNEPVSPTDFITQVLKNFWKAVAIVNPEAEAEPETSVLWGAIGANACHIALAPILKSILQSTERHLTVKRFEAILGESQVANYPFWFSKAGTKHTTEHYPGQKGEGTTMTGAANYGRLAKILEQEWRAKLHSDSSGSPATA